MDPKAPTSLALARRDILGRFAPSCGASRASATEGQARGSCAGPPRGSDAREGIPRRTREPQGRQTLASIGRAGAAGTQPMAFEVCSVEPVWPPPEGGPRGLEIVAGSVVHTYQSGPRAFEAVQSSESPPRTHVPHRSGCVGPSNPPRISGFAMWRRATGGTSYQPGSRSRSSGRSAGPAALVPQSRHR